jgi:hypothetical protein
LAATFARATQRFEPISRCAETADAVSPSMLGIGEDLRVLGVCVYELQITGR